jgi:hypothetical protein
MAGWRPLILALALSAFPAQAHIVYGTKTLSGLVAESALVLRGRIVTVEGALSLKGEPSGSDRPSVEAEVLEVLKGSLEAERVRFVQHGHGVARFEQGAESLLFLQPIARSRELDSLGRSGAFAWVSLQEHDQEYTLAAPSREPLLKAVRAYVAAFEASADEPRLALLRRANRALLTSGDARLAASSLKDLTAAPQLALLTAEDLPALESVLDDPGTSMGVRVALLSELQRRRLVTGSSRWLELLSSEVPSRDRVTAVRAAASSTDPAVRSRLIALIEDPDSEVAAAAAVAVARPGASAAVAPLTAALSSGSPRVRMAAVRGLGRIATPQAVQALRAAAASSSDPETRRRAEAELRKQRPAPHAVR